MYTGLGDWVYAQYMDVRLCVYDGACMYVMWRVSVSTYR